MVSLKLVLALAPRMFFTLRNKFLTSTTIDAKSTSTIERTSRIVGTEFGRFELTVLAGVTQTVLVGLVTVALKFQLVSLLVDARDAIGAVHAGMGASRANVKTKFAGETDITNGTHAMFKVLTMSRIKGAIETVDVELFEDRKVFFTLAANASVLTGQVAVGVFLFVADTKFTDGSSEAFRTIATHDADTRKRKTRIKLKSRKAPPY